MIEAIWNYKIQIAPIICGFIIMELPNIIRRHKKYYYVPLYFTVLPFYEVNENLAYYLNEDTFCIGESMSGDQKSKLKRKILQTSIISTVISAIFIPVVSGFIFAFFMSKLVFLQFIVLLLIYKFIAITGAINNFRYTSLGSRKNIATLVLIYVIYLFLLYQMTLDSYLWTTPFVENNKWGDMFYSIGNLLFTKGIAVGLLMALFSGIFITWITKREDDK